LPIRRVAWFDAAAAGTPDKLFVHKPFSRSIGRVSAAVAISAAALWLAARNAHVDGLRSALVHADFVWLLPYPVICVVLNLIRGEIWRQFLRRRVTTAQAFWAYSVGFLANNVLPFRLGEAVRVVVLSKRCELPVVEVAAAAGLERLLDLAILAVLLAAVGPRIAHIPGLMTGALLVVAIVVLGVVAIAMLVRWRDRSVVAIERATGWLSDGPRRAVAGKWRDLTRGLSILLKPSVGIPATGAAAAVWILTVVLQWLVLRSFQPQAGAVDATFMVAAVSLAIALPAAPGFVGVYHLAGQQALMVAFPGLYDANTALAATTVAHAVSYVTSTALGVIGLWYFGMPPAAITGALRDGGEVELPTDDADSLARV
jgi:uncharacterized protein (TIRG00374 family)